MEMVVYLDGVLLLNALTDYLLLLACGNLTASPIRRVRVGLAGVLGGGYAMLSLVPGLTFLGGLFWQAVFAVALCLVAFGPGKMLLRQSIVLFLLAAAFSGVVLLLTELFSAPAALVGKRVYYPVSFGVLVLTAGGAYGGIAWGLNRLQHHGGDVVQTEISLGGQTVHITALRDTGNTLKDPISGCGVLIADGEVFRKLLPGLEPGKDPAALLAQVREAAPETSPRLIPYKTIGVENGLLLALKPQEVKISGKQETLLIACSPVPVSDGGGYEALLGGAL